MKEHHTQPSAGHILILLLLLGATCIAPVMAGSQTSFVEDGVHLIKSDDSPTVLDPSYYKNMLVTTDFVVEGDQFYWVRIGNVKAEGLMSVWWSVWVALALTLVAFVAFFFDVVLDISPNIPENVCAMHNTHDR